MRVRHAARCILLSFLTSQIAASQWCSSTRPKLECGFIGIAQQDCKRRNCCWQPSEAGSAASLTDTPCCYHASAHPSEYELVSTTQTDNGWTAILRNLTSSQPELGPDITTLQVVADTTQQDILHIEITDLHNVRWRIPSQFYPRGKRCSQQSRSKQQEQAAYELSYSSTPFSFAVARKGAHTDTQDIFNTTGQRLVFKDQYLELTSSIAPNSTLFGLEERSSSRGLQLARAGIPLALWNKDTLAANADQNLYGSHPFLMEVRSDGKSHGMLLMSSNAMDAVVEESSVSWRVTGGMLDLYILLGPSPAAVLEQLTSIIGRPALPPFWSLGFHQCKWGYKNVEEVAEVVAQYKAAGIPLEAMWTDIDYMDGYRDFSLDPNNFSKNKMQAFVDQLHGGKQKWVPIVDPGIKLDPGYPAYDEGIKAKAFVQDFTGKPYLGQVWPGATHFPDFLSEAGVEYWGKQLHAFYQLAHYDGLWIDMNEASNFCTGEVCKIPSSGVQPNASAWLTSDNPRQGSSNDCQLECDSPEDLAQLTPQQKLYIDPPYRINSANGQPINQKTLGVTAVHADGSLEYNAHNLYGLSEAAATYDALQDITGKRPFMLTRSSFLGTGARAAHWTGDNAATWEDLRWSITTTLGMGLVGIPFVGADICGFTGDTTEELCNRWISVGAFYPFSRDHNNYGSIPQELYRWQSVVEAGRRALGMRYRLLPHLYTAFHQAHTRGTPLAKPLWFAFPSDPATHSIDDQWLLGDVLITPILHQGETKRQAYFPQGKWYNLFDNSTIDAKDGGRAVEVELQLGQVGVHTPGGTILPLQQPALLTEDVRASPLTLLVALPHLQPLPLAPQTEASPIGRDSIGTSVTVADIVADRSKAMLQSGMRSFLAKSKAAVSSLVHGLGGELGQAAPAQGLEMGVQEAECGVSVPGRATACGRVYMDDGDQLQVGRSRDSMLWLYAEVTHDMESGHWAGRLSGTFIGEQQEQCGGVSWPVLNTVMVKGLPLASLMADVDISTVQDSTESALPSDQVALDGQNNQLTVSNLQHRLQCKQNFEMTWRHAVPVGTY